VARLSRRAEKDYSGFGPYGPIFPRNPPYTDSAVVRAGQKTCCVRHPLSISSLHLPRYSLYIVPITYALPSYQMFSLSHHVSRLPILQITTGFSLPGLIIPGVVDRCAYCLIRLCMSCAHDYRSVFNESYERSSSSDSDPPCRSKQ